MHTASSTATGNAGAAVFSDSGAKDWKAQKEDQARRRKLQNDMKKIEDRIAVLEARNQEIDELLTQESVYTNMSECLKLNKEQEAIREETDRLFEEWEALEQEES